MVRIRLALDRKPLRVPGRPSRANVRLAYAVGQSRPLLRLGRLSRRDPQSRPRTTQLLRRKPWNSNARILPTCSRTTMPSSAASTRNAARPCRRCSPALGPSSCALEQHGVAVAEEAIALGDGVAVGAADVLRAREGA